MMSKTYNTNSFSHSQISNAAKQSALSSQEVLVAKALQTLKRVLASKVQQEVQWVDAIETLAKQAVNQQQQHLERDIFNYG